MKTYLHFTCNVALILAALCLPMVAWAEPITFRFEAEVVVITSSTNVGFPLPPEIAIGEIFNGFVKFEPPFAFGGNTYGASLLATIGPYEFQVSNALFETIDDTFSGAGNSIQDRDLITVGDGVSVLTPSVGAMAFTSIDGLDVPIIGLVLQDSSSTASDLLDRPASIEVWNRFSNRRLLLQMTSQSASGSYEIQATLIRVVDIPEPASVFQASMLMATVAIMFPFRHRTERTRRDDKPIS